jgi:hypothetical protein
MSKRTPLGMWAEARRADREQEKVGNPVFQVLSSILYNSNSVEGQYDAKTSSEWNFVRRLSNDSRANMRSCSSSGQFSVVSSDFVQILALSAACCVSEYQRRCDTIHLCRLQERIERRRPLWTPYSRSNKFRIARKSFAFKWAPVNCPLFPFVQP